jgi:glutamine amidotransferase
MARLFGLIGNRADLGGRVLAHEGDVLRVKARGAPLAWGLGFFQGGEVLMRRRPLDERQEIDVAQVAGDVRADVILGHVRSATVGEMRTENTHPFRYRQWLFAQTGTVPQFREIRDRLVTSLPEFLRAGIRGETDAEIVFHVFLSFLHDRGVLTDAVTEASVVRDVLRTTVTVVDQTAAEVGGEPGSLNLMVTNGDAVYAFHRGTEMRYRVFSGKDDGDAIIGDDQQLRRRASELSRMRFVLLASDFEEVPTVRWKPVADRSVVTVTRDGDPRVEGI